MNWIYDLSYDELKEQLVAKGFKSFNIDQIFQWLYQKNIPDISRWTNISKSNREILSSSYDTSRGNLLAVDEDLQGTRKILVDLRDGHKIEAVLIREKHHYTFCISTQVGCPLKCAFCATGALGFKRNLSSGEIIIQVMLLKSIIPDFTGKLNIVLMGMGEPLLNYGNLKKALEIITSDGGVSISPRNITLSTAGILEGIKRFEADFPRVKISFSLNASGSGMRERLMPISKTERLEEILDYFRSYKKQRKFRVTFEYVMLKGINDSLHDARKLVNLVRGIPCKINLIPYNGNEIFDFKTPDDIDIEAFSDFLHQKGFTVIVRWSKGRDIKSACGQLAANHTVEAGLSVSPNVEQ
jgi:23S rRNA (adenine2503-C2)-methyltransferase